MILSGLKNQIRENHNFIIFSFVKILSLLLMAAQPFLIAKLLRPSDFGLYSLILMPFYFFGALLISSSQNAFIVYSSDEQKEGKGYNRSFTAELIMLSGGFFVFFAFLMGRKFYSQIIPASPLSSLTIILAYLGLMAQSLFSNVLLANQQRKEEGYYQLCNWTIGIIYIIIAHLTNFLTPSTALLTFFFGPIITFPLFFKIFCWKKILPLKFEKKWLKNIWAFSKWAALGGVAAFLSSWGDILILKYFVSPEKIGEYNLGYQVFKGLTMFAGTISAYFLPSVARNIGVPKELSKYLYQKRPQIIAIWIIGSIVLFFSIPLIFHLLYGNKYLSSIIIAQMLIIPATFVIFKSFYQIIFVFF